MQVLLNERPNGRNSTGLQKSLLRLSTRLDCSLIELILKQLSDMLGWSVQILREALLELVDQSLIDQLTPSADVIDFP